MNTSTARNAMSLSAQQTSEVHARPSGAAGKSEENAKSTDSGAQTPSSPVQQETMLARVPRGPFKILTIPQAWYDSLHAASAAAGGPGKERG